MFLTQGSQLVSHSFTGFGAPSLAILGNFNQGLERQVEMVAIAIIYPSTSPSNQGRHNT